MSYLDSRIIATDVAADTSDEIITYGADILYRNGYVQEGYKEAIRKREMAYPTGIEGEKISVAIPHATCELVKKPAIAVLIPEKPVEFRKMGSSDEKVKCGIVFMLVIKNPDEQLDLLKKVMLVIQNGELLEQIRNSKDSQEIIQYLQELDEP